MIFPTTAAGEHRTDADGLVRLKTCFPSSLSYVQVVGVINKALEPFLCGTKRLFLFRVTCSWISQASVRSCSESVTVTLLILSITAGQFFIFLGFFFFSFISGGYRCRVIMKERSPSTKICTNCIMLACLSEIKHLVIDE